MRLPGRRRRHLEGEAEARQVLARMVVREGELRQPVVVRARLLALVDRRIEIDEVPAWLAGRLHDDLDIALAIETAGIARGRVVVDQRVDVGGLAPAHALEMDAEGGAGRPARDVQRQRGRHDPERAGLALSAGVRPEPVRSTKIVGRSKAEFDIAGGVSLGLGNRTGALLPAAAADA